LNAEGLRYLALSVVLFGGIWPVTKAALAHATPLWFATSRAGLACLVSVLLLAVLGRLRWPRPADWPTVWALGLLQLGGFFALSHLALAYVPAGRTAILANVTVFWLIPLSMLVFGERVSPRQWLAVGAGLAGVVLLMQPWALAGKGRAALPGYAMLLLCSLFWSLAILVTRRWRPESSILQLLPFAFGIAAVCLAGLAGWREPAGGIGREVLWHVLFIGCIAAPLGTWGTVEAGRRLSGTMASVGFLMVPLLGVTIATFWLGEPVGWDLFGGGLLIAASVALVARGT
jgi:drug/metabolite transporter (DMT)-like permease